MADDHITVTLRLRFAGLLAFLVWLCRFVGIDPERLIGWWLARFIVVDPPGLRVVPPRRAAE